MCSTHACIIHSCFDEPNIWEEVEDFVLTDKKGFQQCLDLIEGQKGPVDKGSTISFDKRRPEMVEVLLRFTLAWLGMQASRILQRLRSRDSSLVRQ